MKNGKALWIVLLAVGFTGGAWAQVVGGSLSGTIRDPTGAGLPDASVTVRNVETGAASF